MKVEMVFTSIQEIEISALCRYKTGGMSANIRVDGIALYGTHIWPTASAFSGKDTAGVFESTDKNSLIAWIDPISGKYLSLRPYWLASPLGIIVMTAILAGFVFSVCNLFLLYLGLKERYFTAFSSVGIMAICIGLLIICVKTISRVTPLEIQLRRELKNMKFS